MNVACQEALLANEIYLNLLLAAIDVSVGGNGKAKTKKSSSDNVTAGSVEILLNNGTDTNTRFLGKVVCVCIFCLCSHFTRCV